MTISSIYDVSRGYMETRFCKLDCVALAALVCYGASLLPIIPHGISNVTGTVLCFILMGVATASAIVPSCVGAAARFVAIIACSLGTGIVGGLILNYFSSGLIKRNWVTYAIVTTLIAYAVAWERGAGGPLHWKRPDFRIPTWASSVKVLASVLLVTAAVVISISSSNHGEKPFTEVWLVPDGPTHDPGGATGAVLGIKSHESSNEDFTVVMNTGKRITTSRVTLTPNQVWTQAVAVEGAVAGASVYRGDPANVPYRAVWLVTQ
ncbi:MAG: hypothetical protein JWR37_3191 [Mycobacterium sp.]|nr:hypothetical protein [Mycobacterium sp.]